MSDASSTVIPLRQTSPPRGWHGIKKRPEPWTAQEYETWSALGGECYLVDSAPGSPAWLNGLQSGFWIRSINDQPFDDFDRSGGRIGDVVIVRAEVPGIGAVLKALTLGAQPLKRVQSERQKADTKRSAPKWKSEPPVLPGKRVYKDSRARYLEYAARHPLVRKHVWFLTELLKRDWKRGIIPRHATIAKAVGCSIATVQRSQACCQHFGFVNVISGQHAHRHNTFEVCWPAGSY
jgi:hypothetical protein